MGRLMCDLQISTNMCSSDKIYKKHNKGDIGESSHVSEGELVLCALLPCRIILQCPYLMAGEPSCMTLYEKMFVSINVCTCDSIFPSKNKSNEKLRVNSSPLELMPNAFIAEIVHITLKFFNRRRAIFFWFRVQRRSCDLPPSSSI